MENITSGKTTIAPDVIITIAKLNTLSVPGVTRLVPVHMDMNRLISGAQSEGVRITVESGVVYVDLYVVIGFDYKVREVSHEIQTKVSRAIEEMVGMEVGKINIHVEDIDNPATADG